MSRGNQFIDDKKRLAALLERLTGISAAKTLGYINEFGVDRILSGADVLCSTNTQREKLKRVFEFKNLYASTKSAQEKKAYNIDSTQKAMEYFINYFADIADREHLVLTCLDSKYKILSTKVISTGTVNSTTTYPREIVKEALFNNAVSVMLSHNHPSGARTPSKQDIYMTAQIEKILNDMDITLADHVIVCGDSAVSFADCGLIGRVSAIAPAKAASPIYEKCDRYITREVKPPSVKAFLAQAKKQRRFDTSAKTINLNDRNSR